MWPEAAAAATAEVSVRDRGKIFHGPCENILSQKHWLRRVINEDDDGDDDDDDGVDYDGDHDDKDRDDRDCSGDDGDDEDGDNFFPIHPAVGPIN